MKAIQVDSTNATLIATVYNTDGSVKSDLAFNTTGISIFVQRIGRDNGTPLTLSNKSNPANSHVDGAFLNLGGGDISVDIPDGFLQEYLGLVRIYGTFTAGAGGTIVGAWYPVVGYNPDILGVGAPTVDEFNARTLPAEDYFDAATDLVALQPDQPVNAVAFNGAPIIISGDPAMGVTITNYIASPNDISWLEGSIVAQINAYVTDRTIPTDDYFDPAVDQVIVATNNDKTNYSLTQTFPTNFHLLGINGSGHINRVVLVDTTSVNTDMRGTNNALLASSYTAAPSASTVAASVRTELSTELARVDTSISSRSSQTSVDTVDGIVDAILVDTNELQTNQGNWVTATGFSTHSAADVWGVAIRTITGGTITTNSDKSGYSLAADQAVNVTKVGGTSVSGPNDLKADVSSIQTIVNKVDTMLILDGAVYQFTANALELAPTGTGGGGDSAETIYTYFTDGTRANAFKADVSGLATTSNLEARTLLAADYFNPSTDTVTVSTASSSGIASSVRTELSTELGRIDASVSSRLASASYTAPANSDIAAILADTNELQTNQGNWVTATGFSTHSAADVWAVGTRIITGGTITTNNDKTGYSLTQSFPANFASLGINPSGHISRVTLVDTTTTNTDMRGTNNALLASSYVEPANADISEIKTVADKLNTALVLDGAVYQFTANALELAPVSSGGGDSAASIYAYFTDGTRANAFKADVSTVALESTSQTILGSLSNLSNNDRGEFF